MTRLELLRNKITDFDSPSYPGLTDDEAVSYLILSQQVPEDQARQMITIERGDSDGDVVNG